MDCRIHSARAEDPLLFFSSQLQIRRKQRQTGRRRERGGWLHKYYANIWNTSPVTARARDYQRSSQDSLSQSRRKMSLLISTEICTTRVSLLSARDSSHFAYAA